jgi:hypothetical protein
VVPQPFLQTVDLSVGTGIRENYPSGLDNVAPLVRLGFQTAPGIGGTTGTVLGFFRVQARYSVRGRRAEQLPVVLRLNMMTQAERDEAYRYLSREHAHSARDLSHVKAILK